MKWFTKEWHGGDLSEEESDAVELAYEAYIKTVAARLPQHLVALALPTDEHMSVHDAKVDYVGIDLAMRRVLLRLLNGDLQVGYGKFAIDFIDAEVVEPNLDELRVLVQSPHTEFLYQEVEIASDGPIIEVRFLLWPYADLTVRCADVLTSWHSIADNTRTDYRSEMVVIGA